MAGHRAERRDPALAAWTFDNRSYHGNKHRQAAVGTAKGSSADRWSISVNGNWRLTFAFEGTDAVLVDYLDYH